MSKADKQSFEDFLETKINHYAKCLTEVSDKGDLSATGQLMIYTAVRAAVKHPKFRPGAGLAAGGLLERGMLDAINDIMVELGHIAKDGKFWEL